MESCLPILTSIEERLKLEKDRSCELVDPTNFRRMIESFFYIWFL